MNFTPIRFIMMPGASSRNKWYASYIRLSSRIRAWCQSLTQEKLCEEEVLITLMTIYDKSDIENVSDAYIRSLVEERESR